MIISIFVYNLKLKNMKTIEEAAKEFTKKYCLNDELHHKIFESGFIFGAKQFAQRWISVEDKLPQLDKNGECQTVLVYDKIIDEVFLAWYSLSTETWRDENRKILNHIPSLWMPLPEPPK